MKVTMLGSGTSVGVPCLGRAGWGRCNPDNPKNRRQRCALLVQKGEFNLLVDAGPDIRNQLLAVGNPKIHGVLITHTHADHIAGMDDLRTYYWPEEVKIPIYGIKSVLDDLTSRLTISLSKARIHLAILCLLWKLLRLRWIAEWRLVGLMSKS